MTSRTRHRSLRAHVNVIPFIGIGLAASHWHAHRCWYVRAPARLLSSVGLRAVGMSSLFYFFWVILSLFNVGKSDRSI